MSIALVSVVILLAAVIGTIALVRFLGKRKSDEGAEGHDLIAYLFLAVAVGVTVISLITLGRAAFPAVDLVGGSTQQVASALAGLVVGLPFAIFLWNRQARRRKTFPESSGWPLYLAVIEGVFTTALVVLLIQMLMWLVNDGGSSYWTDVVILALTVGLHELARREDPPGGDAADLPRVVGSAIGLITASIGLTGLLWALGDRILGTVVPTSGGIDLPEFAIIFIVGLPLWAWRWLPKWDTGPEMPRKVWVGLTAVVALTTALGAALTIIVTWIDSFASANDSLDIVPGAASIGIVAFIIWWHHRGRLDLWWSHQGERNHVLAGYQYLMAAIGLAFAIGSLTALVAVVFETDPFISTDNLAVFSLAATALVSTATWLWFWTRAQAQPREIEATIPPRRVYLVGMAVITGLTAIQAVIAALVVVFQLVLGLEASQDTLITEGVLAVLAILATWHLLAAGRADRSLTTSGDVAMPFTVTIIASHPGKLAGLFPKEARTKVIYRGDDAGVVTDAMAEEIVAAIDNRDSIVWVDGDGFRVGPAR
jgi:hypothetical protein